MRKPEHEAAELENHILTESGFTEEQLRRNKMKGTRRMGRLLPDVSHEEVSEGVKLVFTLPMGGYATILLREFMKTG
jgi:tRNA(Glu) U13 pseudouridine synthase TruD